MSAKIFMLFALFCVAELASGTRVSQAQPSSNGLFAADLFNQIAKDKLNKNVIISPISIQAAMAMAFMGSEGETATELQKGLRLSSANKDVVGQEFSEILKAKKGEAKLIVANKIYANSGNKLRSRYNDLLTKYFKSEAESVDFSQSAAAIESVNRWIAKATNNRITNILQPGSVDDGTSAVIVNAIYFKGKWQNPFSKHNTRNMSFWVSKTRSVNANLMFAEDDFLYGEFPELDATGIEMAYKGSDLSMFVLLPNVRDGLGKLEEKLGSVALNGLSSRMTVQNVMVHLPKFNIEFSTSLIDVLKSMGIKSVFESNANLSGIFEAGPPLKITDVQHKAFIDVNEAGSEATAAMVIQSMFHSLSANTMEFRVDHPFVYAIKSSDTVYFVGHYVQP